IMATLGFLSNTRPESAPRHDSLRAVFNHSWSLLSEEEKRVLRNLPVFRGGWDEDAAESILDFGFWILEPQAIQNPKSEIQNHLLSLVDKSLLRRDATGRFEIHEVVRQYAAEKLSESP